MTTTEFLRRARRDGWQASPTRGGHIRLEHPDAAGPVIAPSTPSDWRSLANTQAEMRRQLRAGQGDQVDDHQLDHGHLGSCNHKLDPRPAPKPTPRPKPEPRDRRPLVGRAIEQGSRRIVGQAGGITVELRLDETRGRSWTVYLTNGASS